MPALLNQRAGARDWWRTGELLATAAAGRPFRDGAAIGSSDGQSG